jgi:hypothetical protein
MAAILGFFGGIVQAIVGLATAAAGLTFFIVLWKSGALPPLIELGVEMVKGFWSGVGSFFSFLGALATSVF